MEKNNIVNDKMDDIQKMIELLSLKPLQQNKKPRNNKEEIDVLHIIYKTFNLTIQHNSRSNKRTDYLHNELKILLEKAFPDLDFRIEQKIKSINSSMTKKVDIAGYKNEKLIIIFPVKFPMSNYSQNRNNSWENQTGELFHIRQSYKNLIIVPINFIFNRVPYLNDLKKISKFENISYKKSFQIYENLKSWNIADEVINYIIDVEHNSNIGEEYDKYPNIINFNYHTPYMSFRERLNPILQ